MKVFAEWLQLNPFDALAGWFASTVLASGIWYSVEPLVQRAWGDRRPTEREWLRLESALAGTDVTGVAGTAAFLIEDSPRTHVRTGLRTIVVTRGALEAMNDWELGKFVGHALTHLSGKSARRTLRCRATCMAL